MPDDIKTMIDTSQSLKAIHILIQRQSTTENQLRILDQKIPLLEDDITKSVITFIDFVNFHSWPLLSRLNEEDI